MSAAITYTRRPMLLRLQCAIAIAWLRWEISSAERWIKDCRGDGITNTKQLRHQELAVQALRVQLAIWQSR